MREEAAKPSSARRGLIRAKLSRPKVAARLVERPHLLEELDRRFARHRVTLVSAPAGYGKSIILSQWLERPSSPRGAWLSLDAMDGDLERFLLYMVAALERLEPGRFAHIRDLLSAHNLPSPGDFAEAMATEVQGFARPAALVLDDYGSIRDEAVHEFLRCLVPDLPETLRLVVLSRIDPSFPIGLWRSRAWLGEIRAVDLRFSLEEARTFFESAGGLELDHGLLELLHRKTEGWIAGLRLALLAIADAEDPGARIRRFSGSDRLVVDYLMQEALAAQPAEVREFLAVTAPLARFNVSLCDHLLEGRAGGPDSRAVIDRLLRTNMFLVSLGEFGGWYRYHHLFQDLLLDRLGELAPGISREDVCRRAGAWCAREGWIEEALHYLVDAGDLDAAADLVAAHLHDVLNSDLSRRTLARWLRIFPRGAEHGRLPLLVASLYMGPLTFQLESMRSSMEEIEDICQGDVRELSRGWIEALEPDLESLRAYVRFFSGDPTGAYERASRAMETTDDRNGYQRSLAILYVGAGLALSPQREAALRFVEDGVAAATVSGSPQIGPYLTVKAAMHHYWGELDACRRTGLESLAVAETFASPRYFQAHVLLFLGNVAYERNLLDEAEAHYLEIESFRFDANRMIFHEALIGLGQVALARGDHASAARRAKEAHALAVEVRSQMLMRNAEGFLRRFGVVAGPTTLSEGLAPAAPDFMYLSLYTPSYSWAWGQMHERSPEARSAALRSLDDALKMAESHDVERRVIQLTVLRAVALHALDREDEAAGVLEGALRRSEPLGFIRAFLDAGPRVAEMLAGVVRREPGDGYAERLSRAFAAPKASVRSEVPSATALASSEPGNNHGPVEHLTNRELDVLELLARRLTNKEIAARLGISSATVKMHTLGIYGKLGVHGRREAVAAAVGLGILGR